MIKKRFIPCVGLRGGIGVQEGSVRVFVDLHERSEQMRAHSSIAGNEERSGEQTSLFFGLHASRESC